jgi:limonene-1,2-epoxide hydrolase
VLALVAVVAIAVGIAIATSGEDHRPPPVSGTPAEAVGVVQTFAAAISTRDFATVCDRLFTPRARAAAGGDNCQSVLAQAAARLRTPTVRITSVVLQRGGKAAVGVVAGLAGERALPDVIHLERRKGRFRIASVGKVANGGD